MAKKGHCSEPMYAVVQVPKLSLHVWNTCCGNHPRSEPMCSRKNNKLECHVGKHGAYFQNVEAKQVFQGVENVDSNANAGAENRCKSPQMQPPKQKLDNTNYVQGHLGCWSKLESKVQMVQHCCMCAAHALIICAQHIGNHLSVHGCL
eukprot:1157926-Pelagomonas_calceolata.AAC.2